MQATIISTYHVQGNDLAVGLLQLAELSHEVPETGLGDHSVGGEDPEIGIRTMYLRIRTKILTAFCRAWAEGSPRRGDVCR